MAFEQCLKEGVEFPEEEKFIHFQREEILNKYAGKVGFQAVLYLEDLVDIQYQITETKAFLTTQFELSEADSDKEKLHECYKYYSDIVSEMESKQMEHFFPEDKIIYETEMWYVQKVLPRFEAYFGKKDTFTEFKINVQDCFAKYDEYKKKQATNSKQISSNQSGVVSNRSQQESASGAGTSTKDTTNASNNGKKQQQQQASSQQSNRTTEQQSNRMNSETNEKPTSTRPPQSTSTSNLKNNQMLQVEEEHARKSSVDKRQSAAGQQNDPADKATIEQLKAEQTSYLKKIKEAENRVKEKDVLNQQLEDKIQITDKQLKEMKLQKEQNDNTIDSLEQQLQEYRLQSMSQKNQNNQKSSEELVRLQQKVNEQVEEKEKLKKKVTFMQNELEQSQQERSLLQAKKKEKDLEVESLLSKIENMQHEIEVQREEIKQSDGRIHEILQEKENEMNVDRFNLENDNEKLQALVVDLEAKIKDLERENKRNAQSNQSEFSHREEIITKLQHENEDQRNLIEQLQQMVAEEEQKANQIQDSYHQAQREIQMLKEDLNAARNNQNKQAQENYDQQILETQILNLTERNKELEQQLEQMELNVGAAPSHHSNLDYQDRSSYQSRMKNYDNTIHQLEQENTNIPKLQHKINELETLINLQQKNDNVSKDSEMQYSQIKRVLAETIERSKQLDTQLNTFIQQKQQNQQQQAYLAQRSSSAQNFRNTAPQNFYKDSDSHRDDNYASSQQLRRGDQQYRSFRGYDQENDQKHYQTQPNFYNPNRGGGFDSQKMRLSQLNSIKFNKLNGMASTSGFQNYRNQMGRGIEQVVDESIALPEKYEEEESQMNQSVSSLNDIRDLRQIDKVGADLIFPFRNPKLYYSNKAKLKNTKGKLIQYDESLFGYLRYPKDALYKFKRSSLKWKFSIFENEDLQIGQISSSDVINNQYIVKFGLYVTNKTDAEVTNLSISYLHSNKVHMKKDQQIMMAQLSGRKQIKQSLTVMFTQIPYEVIVADVEYRCHGFNQKFQVPIPCLITKYIEIQELVNPIQFKSLWKEISKFNLIASEDCQVNRQIAKSPQDYHNYFPHFINLNPDKASQYHLGLNDYIMGGQIYLRQPNVTFMLKVYLKPNNMIQFKIASGSEAGDRSVVEFFMQNLLYLFTQQ